MKKRNKCTTVILLAFTLILISVVSAFASLIYDYSTIYSGSAPSGTQPWMTATFETGSTPGTVDLTLQGTNLSSTEFVSSIYFNYTGTNPLNIGFSSPWEGAAASFSPNAYNGDGAGGFDIQILFPVSSQQDRFVNGDTAYLTIMGTGNPFDFYATNAGPGILGIYTGAHVQGIGLGGSQSGWATVPIPPTVWLLGAGLLGMIAIRRGFLK